ncbi:hypothetical protein V6N13_113789 [Hibiscus sabdariffa]|uniref:Uncharacterized protein n=1 Tax=Hibiscus sabdariffa TaxID=183260 RepID=A0ABR2TZY4_9ROSI
MDDKMVNSYREHQFRQVFDDFTEMGRQGIKKNNITFFGVLKACDGMDYEGMSRGQVHTIAFKLGFETEDFVHYGCSTCMGNGGW